MNRCWMRVKRVLGEIWLGITISERNRHRSGWGKF